MPQLITPICAVYVWLTLLQVGAGIASIFARCLDVPSCVIIRVEQMYEWLACLDHLFRFTRRGIERIIALFAESRARLFNISFSASLMLNLLSHPAGHAGG